MEGYDVFTGIIEEIGILKKANRVDRGRTLEVRATTVLDGLKPDDSIAVNGVCLTVVRLYHASFESDVVETTMKKTTIGSWPVGKEVNLERAMRADNRFGGHFVQGHVDGTGIVVMTRSSGDGKWMEIEIRPEISRYIVRHGSVTVDGVSLTVAGLIGNRLQLALIPHTIEKTNLDLLVTGDSVNIETDILGKYLEKWILPSVSKTSDLNEKRLKELGY